MPSFAYKAMAADGTKNCGTCEAPNLRDAAESLRAGGRFVLDLREVAEPNDRGITGSQRRTLGYWRPVSSRDLVLFFRHMGLMLRSGLPLLQALDVYRVHATRRGMAAAARRCAAAIRSGAGFSKALSAERGLFPELAVKLAATGEATGELGVMLDRIADQIEHKSELRNSLLASMVYPGLVVIITIAVVVFLISFVIPKFTAVLAQRKVALPASTQLLVDISEFVNRNGTKTVTVLLGALVILVLVWLTRPGRLAIDRLLLSVPVIGHMLTLAFMAQFGRTLAILLKSGMPALESLGLLGESTGNRAFARHLKKAATLVLGGRPLSEGLDARIIPPVLPAMVSIGEASGNLDTILEELGIFHEKKLSSELKWLSSLFEPAMILVVGGLVGFVYISFFQVLYQLAA